MKLVRAVAGQQIQAEEFFRQDNGQAAIPIAPVEVIIRDFSGNLVQQFFAAQDPQNTSRWLASFVIPATAPIGKPGQKYQITWKVKTATSTDTKTDFFDVVPNDPFLEDINGKDIDGRMMLANTNFYDRLVLPASIPVTTISVDLVNLKDSVVYSSGPLSPLPEEANNEWQAFSHKSANNDISKFIPSTMNFSPYQVRWTYTANGEQNFIFHYLYAVNGLTMDTMRKIRARIDKARNKPYNPALFYYDLDLLCYIDLGIARFNAARPTLTYFSMSSLPDVLQYPVIECSCYEALRSQLMAESVAAFNFSGQSVSLDMDRTQAIESELSKIQQYIDQEIPSLKKRYNRSGGGGVGVLGINFASSSTSGWARWNHPLAYRMVHTFHGGWAR